MTLLQARRGQKLRIVQIPDERARAQCVRFGIGEGTVVDSAEVLRVGPVLIRHCNQEICLGRGLAARIEVEDGAPGEAACAAECGPRKVECGPRGVGGRLRDRVRRGRRW